MNIYDPLDSMVYQHLPRQSATDSGPATAAASVYRLPLGYANESPRTRLGRAPQSARCDCRCPPPVP